MQPARRITLTDDVYAAVQALIMDHEVQPGARINIDALARRLAVSPTPVREALARLESDGLVSKTPLVGYTATPLLTRAEFEELVEMRLVLEPAGAAKAAGAGLDTGELAGLRGAADLPGPGGADAVAAFTAQDARFHHTLAELSGNRMLHAAVVRLRAHLHLFRLHFPTAHYGVSASEHHRIVDAVDADDADAAADAMRAHLTAARDRHLPFFESR
ncbi:DNA-binding transcriptional regulator, GntR family [Asanoa hainanensis]|uniref:DNA-binding transcriptional regulator, GntR family n=1 Tax=Asanoa hainanensis TaxID=560556 RepID=A0A239PDV2_9ACTN|nr:GntR family transcriptional regulator [Asanoa hainanensis]SNT65210.1 DNA-binding transcriptional regulator, GntR family [Asanoa hainanensis]